MTDQESRRDPRLDPRHPPPWQPLDRLVVSHLWQVAKQIDELGGEWTYTIFVLRTLNFNLVSAPIGFYEPIESFDRLLLELILINKADNFGLSSTAGMAGVAFTVFPSIYDAEDGVLVIPEEDEPPLGQHYMRSIGIDGHDTLVVVNSWSGWTADNLGYVSREYFERYATEGFVYRRWDYGPADDTAERLFDTSDRDEFRQLWRRRQRFGLSNSVAPNKGVRLKWYATWSMQDERPAEILVVELSKRIRVGVAMLVHYEATDDRAALSCMIDFFVWPNYRRVGYGRILEKFAEERSIAAGSREIGVHVWNADAVNGMERAKAFLRATGYTDVEEFADRQYLLYARRAIS